MPRPHWKGIFKNTFFSLQFKKKKKKNPCTHRRYFKMISSTSSHICRQSGDVKRAPNGMVWENNSGEIVREMWALRDIPAPCPNWEMETDKILLKLVSLLLWGIEQILYWFPDWFLWIFCVDKSRPVQVFSANVNTRCITSLSTLNRTNKCSVFV